MTYQTLKSALVVFATMAGLAIANAEDKHDHGSNNHEHAKSHDDGNHEHGHADKRHHEVTEPKTIKEAWQQITDGLAATESNIDASAFDSIHAFAEQLEESLHFLADHSSAASEKNRKRLESVIKQLDKVADSLHHAAEDKDLAKIKQETKKAQSLLPLAEAQYPKGTLQ